MRAPDPELHELVTPYQLLEYEIEPDSGGAGQWRGGLGVRYSFKVDADNVACANFGSGARDFTAPQGINDGKAAPPHHITITHADGSSDELDGNRMYTFNTGDVISIHSSGGGGYGDPLRRDAKAVLRDVQNGIVSEAAAREQYGVVLRGSDGSAAMTIDEKATAALRN